MAYILLWCGMRWLQWLNRGAWVFRCAVYKNVRVSVGSRWLVMSSGKDARARMAVAAGGAAVVAVAGMAQAVSPHLSQKSLTPTQKKKSQTLFLSHNKELVELLVGDQRNVQVLEWEIHHYDLREGLTGWMGAVHEWVKGTFLDNVMESVSGNNKLMHTSIKISKLTKKKEKIDIEIEYGPEGIRSFVGGNQDRAEPVGKSRQTINARVGKRSNEDVRVKPRTYFELYNFLYDLSGELGADNYGVMGFNCNEFTFKVSDFLSNGCHNDEGVNRQAKQARGAVMHAVEAVGGAAQKVFDTGAAVAGAAWQNPVSAGAVAAVVYYKKDRLGL